jgi:hypothetical protein
MGFRMQRTIHRPNGILAPADVVRSRRHGRARPVAPPEPVPVDSIDALADIDRAWSAWRASLPKARPAA